MNSIKPQEIKKMLSARALDFCKDFLPNGKMNNQMWEVGSVSGEKGQSCKVYLDGSGYYDFAESESGSLIDLYMAIKEVDFPQAFEDLKKWLGVISHEKPKTYQKPKKPKGTQSAKTPVIDYLVSRKISKKTIEDYRIAQGVLKGKEAIVFPFINGETKQIKRLMIERPEGKKIIQAESNCEPCLFGWQCIPKKEFPAIVICEGEIDAMSFYEYSIPALSVPFGGGSGAKQNWIDNEFENLSRFDEIILALDTDEEGQKANHEICNRLGLDRCKIAKLPYKDANECLMNGVALDQIVKCFDEAKHVDIEEIKRPSESLQKTIELMYSNEAKKGILTPWAKVNSEWCLGWNELTLVNGINAHGKSELVNQIMLNATFEQGHSAFVSSMEIPHHLLNRRLIKQATATNNPARELAEKCIYEFDEKIWYANQTEGFNQNKLLEVMTYAYKRYETRIFIVDSLMKCGIGEDDYSGQKLFVEKLCDFKNLYPVHVLLVVHPRKGQTEEGIPGKMDVAGAGGITNLADNLLTVWRNKKRERVVKKRNSNIELSDDELNLIENSPGVMLALQKDRNGGNEQSFGLFYKNYQFLDLENQRNKIHVSLLRAAS
jgi:twinkle protein